MNKYKLKLEVDTAMFIGCGHNLNKMDYFTDIDEDLVYVIDNKKFIKELKKYNLQKLYMDYCLKKRSTLNDFIIKNNIKDKLNLNNICKFKIKCNSKDVQNDLQLFLRDGLGKIYIPGSSIKGAISNAILHKKLMELKKTNLKSYNELFELFKRNNYKLENEMQNKLFPNFKKYFECIAITDSLGINNFNSSFMQKKDYTTDGSKNNNLSVYRECVLKGFESIHELTIYDVGEYNISFDYILEALGEFMDQQLQIIDYFEEKEGKNIFSEIQDSNIILGGGAGFFNKTLVYSLNDDFNKIKEVQRGYWKKRNGKDKFNHEKKDTVMSPRTVKLVSNNDIMGLCTLSGEKYDL